MKRLLGLLVVAFLGLGLAGAQQQATGNNGVTTTISQLWNMKLNEWGQLVAWVAAALFFGYKILSGYLITDLSLKMSCERKHNAGELDYLSVTVTAKNAKPNHFGTPTSATSAPVSVA